MANMINRELKENLLKQIRKNVTKEKSMIMVGHRPIPNQNDVFLVSLSENIFHKAEKLPKEYEGFAIMYLELEPFAKYRKKLDKIY